MATQITQMKPSQNDTGFTREAVSEISNTLRELLADVFCLYIKTKNFHWHMTGRHFRDYHLLLDEQAEQIFAMTDDIAERSRKIGDYTLRSIGDIARHQRLKDSDDGSMLPRKCSSICAMTTCNWRVTSAVRTNFAPRTMTSQPPA